MQKFALQSYFGAIFKKHITSVLQYWVLLACLLADCWLGICDCSVPKEPFCGCEVWGFFCSMIHNPLSSRSTTHDYFLDKSKTEKRGLSSDWVTSVVCQQVARLLISHLLLIWIISRSAPAGQRMGMSAVVKDTCKALRAAAKHLWREAQGKAN